MQNMKNISLRILALWFFIFTGIWAILDPLGGMDSLRIISSSDVFLYLMIAIATLLLSSLIYITKNFSEALKLIPENNTTSPSKRMRESRIEFNYANKLKSANKIVQILGLSLPSFASESGIKTLTEILINEINVFILLANPLSPYLSLRPGSLYKYSPNVRITCAETLAVFMNLKNGLDKGFSQHLHLRILNTLPNVGTVRVDDEIMWSPYLINRTGATSPYFIDHIKSPIGSMITDNFNKLWNEYSFKLGAHLDLNVLKESFSNDLNNRNEVTEDIVETISRTMEGILK